MARITAFSPGQSPPPVKIPTFIFVPSLQQLWSDTNGNHLSRQFFPAAPRIAHSRETTQVPQGQQLHIEHDIAPATLLPEGLPHKSVGCHSGVSRNPIRES